MSEITAAFIAELVRAANEVDRLTNPERARLLQRAAETIRDYRKQVDAESPSEGAGDIIEDLKSMADTIDLHGPNEVGAMILDAIAAIKAGRSDVEHATDAEYEDLIEEINNPDGTT